MAENLIASLLVFYKETTAPLAKLPHVPPVFQEIQVYIDSACKDTTAAHLATTTTTHGSTTVLEQQPLKIARDRSILALSSTASLVDRLFYVIMNLTRPSMGYLESIEVKENSYEDIEFRALVRRMANKLELETPTTQIEKDKARLYRFIELIILDPQKYATVDQVSKIMSKSAWWSDILRHDLVIYLYSHEFRPQMSLFSEILRIIGISYTPYVPVPVHSTLDENTAEFNAQVLIQIAKFKDTLVFNCFRELDQLQENISTFEGSGQQHELLLQSMFESAMALTLDGGKVILEMLESSTNGLVAALRDSNSGKVDVSSLFEMTQILARFVIVAPSSYLTCLLCPWMFGFRVSFTDVNRGLLKVF
ncbi:hypothetical protein BG004_007859 [Podila humilis]|nr:hypothetical protein BG004_007859 [Podila humilis]